jgi:hypothetical protein
MSHARSFIAASLAAACALALHAPSTAQAQCDPDLFKDKANEPNFFWNELDCSARDGLSDTLAAVDQKVVLAGYKTILNMYVKGLGDAVSGVMEKVMASGSGSEVFGPSNMDLMYAIQAGTNQVISRLNRSDNDADLNRAKSVESTYLEYQQDPTFYTRVVKAQSEWVHNQLWFETLGSLSLDRHGPWALHAAMSMTEVYARRMMDLELAMQVIARKPGAPSYKEYLETVSADERDDMTNDASKKALGDMKVMFNGGKLPTGDSVPGFFNDLAQFANGGFRSFSDSRFSEIQLKGTHNDFCGSNFGKVDRMEGSYHFPLDPNDPGNNANVPKYDIKIFWDACQHLQEHQTTVEWTLEVKDSKGKVIFTRKYDVPVLDGNVYTLDSKVVTGEPVRLLKQAAYERFLSISYGPLRPKLDGWWKIVGNPGYPNFKADAELNQLMMESYMVYDSVAQLGLMAPEWREAGLKGSDLRLVLDYVLTWGTGGLDELIMAPFADRIAWSANNGSVPAAEYRSFIGSLTDPGDAMPYYKGQMAAKIVAITR